MLNEEVAKYRELSGDTNPNTPISRIGGYLDGYEKALEQESKTGRWIEHPEIETSIPEYLMFYECSECGDKQCFCKPDIHKKHFCNNCGARMVESQERSDKE